MPSPRAFLFIFVFFYEAKPLFSKRRVKKAEESIYMNEVDLCAGGEQGNKQTGEEKQGGLGKKKKSKSQPFS